MSSEYNPINGIRNARKAMDAYTRKQSLPVQINTTPGLIDPNQPMPCAVLLRSLVDGGPVPDDFGPMTRSGKGLSAHVRHDGAVYLGAFELQNTKDSVVLVYGPPGWDISQAERIATLERPALMRRHADWLRRFPTPADRLDPNDVADETTKRLN